MEGAPLRVAIYPRVSTDGQSIESQIAELTRFVASRGWQLVRPPETYADDAISGTLGTGGREGLRRLLEDAAAGHFDAVVVCGISRITRADDWIDRAAAVGGLQRAGVQIADAHTGALHDMATDQGDLLVGLGAFLASVERKNILRQTARGKRQAVASGRKPQGVDPYGYQSGEDGVLQVREDEAAVVRTIYARLLEGLSCREVAEALNAQGAPLRARKNAARRWSRDRVLELARSTTYRGEYVVARAADGVLWSGTGAVLRVPPIVDETTWYEVQPVLTARKSSDNPRTGQRRPALASGRVRCGICGQACRIAWGKTSDIRYYVCRGRRRQELFDAPCTLRYWRVEDVDELLWSRIRALLEEGWRRVADEIAAAEARDPADDRRKVEDLERRLQRLGRARSVILRQHADGAIDDVTLQRELDELAGERDRTAAEAARLRETAEARWTTEDLGETVDAIRATLDACAPADRLEIVRALIPGHEPYVVTLTNDAVDAVLRLDPRAWIGQVQGSSRRTTRTSYPPALDVRLSIVA